MEDNKLFRPIEQKLSDGWTSVNHVSGSYHKNHDKALHGVTRILL